MVTDNRQPVSILFVDDEQIMRDGLSLTIDWAAAGLTVAGTAPNGAKALELCEKTPVDIVVTDIRMPVMDGLELSRRLMERYPQIKIVILSAYEDFQYARQAVNLGAGEYLLKAGLDCDDLLAVVLRLADEVLSLRSERQASLEMAEKLRQQMRELSDSFLLGLLTQVAYPPELRQKKEDLGIPLEEEKLVLAHICHPGAGREDFPLRAGLAELLCNVCFVASSQSHVAAVGNWRGGRPAASELAAAMESLCRRAGEEAGLFYSGCVDGLENLCAANTAVMEHLRIYAFYGRSGAFFCGKPPQYREEPRLESVLIASMRHLEHNRLDAFHALISETFSSVQDGEPYNPQDVREFAYMAIRLLLERAQDGGPVRSAQAESAVGAFAGNRSLRQAIYQCGDLSSLRREAGELIQTISGLIAGRMRPYGKIVNSAIEYISLHIREEVTLGKVAAEVFCAPAYLSQVFKKETGENFSEYLAKTRIQLARVLLETSDLTVREVGERVGLNNPSYFSKLFCRIAGIQPGQYRAVHNR